MREHHNDYLCNGGVEKHRVVCLFVPIRSSSRGELSDSLGPLAHGVLGQLSGQHQPHRCLNLPRCQRLGLADLDQLACKEECIHTSMSMMNKTNILVNLFYVPLQHSSNNKHNA